MVDHGERIKIISSCSGRVERGKLPTLSKNGQNKCLATCLAHNKFFLTISGTSFILTK